MAAAHDMWRELQLAATSHTLMRTELMMEGIKKKFFLILK